MVCLDHEPEELFTSCVHFAHFFGIKKFSSSALDIYKQHDDNKVPKKYKSCNTVNNERHYPVEFINKLTPSGFSAHIIRIKVGRPIMLLRNLDPQNGH